MFLVALVCLFVCLFRSVCLSVCGQHYSKRYERFLKRFIYLVEIHYHKVNLSSDNQILHVKFSNPSAAVLCHNSPEEVTWLVIKI